MQFIGATPLQMIMPGEDSGQRNDIECALMVILNNENCFYLPAVIFAILVSNGAGLTALESDDRICADSPVEPLPGYNPDWPASFRIGSLATTEEINSWDTDITADGTGLPDGKGTVPAGRKLYESLCQSCHGENGQGKPFDALAGHGDAQSYPFPDDKFAVKTIGNYWPYATTLFDYTNRTMPFASPGSLSPDEVYSITAYLLYLNNLIPEKTVLTADNLASIDMPARNRFVAGGRCGSK